MSEQGITRFLRLVWSKQPEYGGTEGWTFLSAKDWGTGQWSDHPALEELEVPTLDDLYFCPNTFSANRRLRANACAGRWLYADLDEVDPSTLKVTPTIAWRTSPGRYQCMWLLDRPLPPRRLEQLNQRMTYFTGADKGGWSLTKVLRVPGSVSNKRDKPYEVKLYRPTQAHRIYKAHDLERLVPPLDQLNPSAVRSGKVPPVPSAERMRATRRRYAKRMPARARQLLNTRTVLSSDDRSAKLWELEKLLLEAGIPQRAVFVLVWSSPWNKYDNLRNGPQRLWTEINKHKIEDKPAPKPKKKAKKPNRKRKGPRTADEAELLSFRDFMTMPLPRASWLVDGIWSDAAHGILAGEPKTYKSLFTLDLAVSIASGTPFLNHFAVPKVGPVIIIQEENTPGDVHDRLLRIGTSRGVGPAVHTNDAGTELDFGRDLPMFLLNNEGFSLTDEKWMRWLELQIRQVRPALVVLDPLYLLAKGVDENSASEMTPILANLLALKNAYGCGIQIVHHYHKPKSEASKRQATRISGTGVFHRWLASAIYVETTSEPQVVKISGEHRSHGPKGAYRIGFDMPEDQELVYKVDVAPWTDEDEAGDTEVDLGKSKQRKPTLTDLILQRRDKCMRVDEAAANLDVQESTIRSRARREGITISRNVLYVATVEEEK